MKDLLEAFEKHDVLNPKIWDENNEMLPEVSKKINEIVDYFMDSLSIKMSPIDVHIVGSNASYNYTDKSDLDVHVVVNFESVDAPKEIVMVLLNNEKSSFNKSHDISIHGVDVEMYVEDVKSTTVSNGIYSLYEEKWIKFPIRIDDVPQVDVSDAKAKWTSIAQNLLNTGSSEEISGAIDTLYMIRKNSIDVDGEYGKGNILFKELRNDGVLQELKDALNSTKSKELSLESYRQKYSNELLEDTRKQLIAKSKHADNYVPWNQHKGRNRFQRRTKSRVANSVREFNSIDMNNLFKMGILTVNINVQGETDKYLVRISFGGFNEILRDFLARNNDILDLRSIIRTLAIGFERDDVYIHCSCPDWRYRFDYWSHKHGTASTANPDDPLDRPAKITNPHDTKGAGCKHVLLCLNNNAWIIKVASVIWNYINYMKEYREKLYADIIYPAIYGKPYEGDVQTSLFDEEPVADDTKTDELDVANEYGRKRTQFKQGNKQGIRFAPEEDRNQPSFEDIEVEEQQ